MTEVRLKMPDSSENEATVTYWHIKQGDRVDAGQDLVELSSAKAVFVVASPVSGVVAEIKALVGVDVNNDEILCLIEVS